MLPGIRKKLLKWTGFKLGLYQYNCKTNSHLVYLIKLRHFYIENQSINAL